MTHVSLYRRFRPTTWDKVIGQEPIVTTLINQINTGAIGHAYLFTGTRGTGKTSSAKIFAKAVNCLSPINGSPCGECAVCKALANPANLDVVEMDAASNNGVDEIRELRENVQYSPTIGKYKVYIIDEVHMLTGAAFNALLKTLEEPPAHAIFILATTEVHKLPQTILSRCLRFDFRLVPKDKLIALLKSIFAEYDYPCEDLALEQIALHGEGSVRDTLSIADMCMSYNTKGLTLADVNEVLGASDFSTLFDLSSAILSGNVADLLKITDTVYDRGKGVSTLNKELSAFFRELIAVKNVNGYRGGYNDEQYKACFALAAGYDNYRIGRTMDVLASIENLLRYSSQPRIVFDASLVKCAELQTEPNIEALLSRVRALETKINSIETNGVTLQNVNKQNVKQQSKKLEETLSQFATTIDAAPVFAEEAPAQEVSESDNQSRAVWSSLLTAVREHGYGLLYKELLKQENYALQDNTLHVNVKDMSIWSMLNANDNIAFLDALLKSEVNSYYTLDVQRTVPKTEVKREERNSLIEMFGSKFKDKNN